VGGGEQYDEKELRGLLDEVEGVVEAGFNEGEEWCRGLPIIRGNTE
jgi:hypothetical protein